MTRAMRQLYFTYAEQRRLHGMDSHNAPSRFLQEVPPEMLEEVRPRIRLSQTPYSAGRNGWDDGSANDAVQLNRGDGSWKSPLADAIGGGMKLGTRVRHGKFGEGTILTIEGQGPHARVQVNFERQGSKWLMLQYANLEVM
jgi:DNA helicase II / ATP-dependent DNA helicase PcrA